MNSTLALGGTMYASRWLLGTIVAGALTSCGSNDSGSVDSTPTIDGATSATPTETTTATDGVEPSQHWIADGVAHLAARLDDYGIPAQVSAYEGGHGPIGPRAEAVMFPFFAEVLELE